MKGATATDVAQAMAWARAVCWIAFGPFVGEVRARRLRAVDVLRAWATLNTRSPQS